MRMLPESVHKLLLFRSQITILGEVLSHDIAILRGIQVLEIERTDLQVDHLLSG